MKFKLPLILLCAATCFFVNNSLAQKKIVIMGSSTAEGLGASIYQLAWAGRLEASFNQNTGDGIDTIFVNIAKGGYNTYQELPTTFMPPAGRPSPDPFHNVTKALSSNPDVVIINLSSNDVGEGFSITETMDNLRLMNNSITASGAKCYITTSQPRNDYTLLQRKALLDMKDSINIQFGYFAINFWDDLVTSDGLNMLRADRKDPTSAVHPNDIGHDFLFGRVRDKNIFSIIPLPVKLTAFTAMVKNNNTNIKWHTEQQEPYTIFEIEKSANGIDFEIAFTVSIVEARQSADYEGIDKNTLPGKSFYKIKVTEGGRSFYSNTITVTNNASTLSIIKLYKDNSSGNLIADINTQISRNVLITIYNIAGAIMQQKRQYITTPSATIILPVANLATGQYFFKVSSDDTSYDIKKFIK
ncbi:GDSL-type esterase/lipase family protein [Ferruginibacter sp.]|uniref:GDSL-type esterase/lipase family protein n=1 Tax=Ferruginibacter sp. TaxID=1940288 RepID=UPI001998EE8C|nr:GDSL-type esterase/lipase family protein [Ferruginibacter sp.]MBC7627426.1 T9SS type A sorting domain-containing protein [Ferruginibacter sp.]